MGFVWGFGKSLMWGAPGVVPQKVSALTSGGWGRRVLPMGASPNIADAGFRDLTPLFDEKGNVIPEKRMSDEELEEWKKRMGIISATPSP